MQGRTAGGVHQPTWKTWPKVDFAWRALSERIEILKEGSGTGVKGKPRCALKNIVQILGFENGPLTPSGRGGEQKVSDAKNNCGELM